MAYQDPYSTNYNYNNAGYSEYNQYSQYNQNPASYPPYEPGATPAQSSSSGPALYQNGPSYTESEKRKTRASFGEPPKNTGDLRLWRHDEHSNLWTKGGRGRCIGRFCCCGIMSTVFLILAVAFSIAMWLRPPDVSFGNIGPPTSGSAIEATADSLIFNLALPISVKNPNFFAASFEKISATARYPINNAELGGGSRDDITFAANSETTFNFPFSIVYTASKDPNQVIVNDIADRCGFTGNARRQIQVKYEITLQIKMIAFSISPSFSGSTGFDCPLTQAQIEPFIGSLGGS